jgi:hypothetical protein
MPRTAKPDRKRIKPGDLIQHRCSQYTVWKVYLVHDSGKLEARNVETGKAQVLTRPEYYYVTHEHG